MGHYASEMDPDWNTGLEETRESHKENFEYHNSYSTFLVCTLCGSVVKRTLWRKHRSKCCPSDGA